jgi:hypothetical protein
MSDDYNEYLRGHIGNTEKAFNWLIENIPELFSEFDVDYLGAQVSMHDISKYSDYEYNAYCEYFYGDSKTGEVKENFDYAWLHHQHNNPHHWQHWLLQNDDPEIGLRILDMPYVFIIECICDWWSFSWKENKLDEIFNWYEKNKEGIILSDKTRKTLESILEKMKEKLEELGNDESGAREEA